MPVRINSLFWPYGASRFARAHFLATASQMSSIRAVVAKAGVLGAAPLTFGDGKQTISTLMWMLPAIPISKAAPGLGLHLLTLVDDRYWWWGQALDLTATTWADMYAQIGTNLGITITADPIASGYGTPPIDYNTGAKPLPMVFDAVAFSCGQRVCRALNGAVTVQNASTAQASVTANLATGPTSYGGGAYDFNPRL